jgi:hypothetical protein
MIVRVVCLLECHSSSSGQHRSCCSSDECVVSDFDKPGSNALNPFCRGHFRRSRKVPTWPWFNGTYQNPRGSICRVCQLAFMIGGFLEEYGDMDALLAQAKKSDCCSVFFRSMSQCCCSVCVRSLSVYLSGLWFAVLSHCVHESSEYVCSCLTLFFRVEVLSGSCFTIVVGILWCHRS